MCCITTQDNVLLATEEPIKLAVIISHMYLPRGLTVVCKHLLEQEYAVINEKIRIWEAICEEYERTKPILIGQSLSKQQELNKSYDVILYSKQESHLESNNKQYNRFYMMLGNEFEVFQAAIKEAAKKLNNDGRLIVLARICWILPIWKLLEECKLQFDYPNYHYYIAKNSNPNEYVWLKFTYKEGGINLNCQKRNLEQYMKENLQYFFTENTTKQLAKLCVGYTACLVVPSVAVCANSLGKQVVLFEKDNRFRTNSGVKYIKYDLYAGLTKVNYRKFANKFSTVICDPPFNVDLSVLARDIYELVNHSKESKIFLIYPKCRLSLLRNAMSKQRMHLVESGFQTIEYMQPPRIVRYEGVEAIQIYRFAVEEKHLSG